MEENNFATATTMASQLKTLEWYLRGEVSDELMKPALEKYFLERVNNEEDEDLTGFKVLGIVEKPGLMYLNLKSVILKTKDEAWISEFTICLTPIQTGKVMILVSPDCPEYYFVESEEIIEMGREIIDTWKNDLNVGNDFWTTKDYDITWTSSLHHQALPITYTNSPSYLNSISESAYWDLNWDLSASNASQSAYSYTHKLDSSVT